jgi:hypothetical protein
MFEKPHCSPETQRIMRLGWMTGRAIRRDGWEKGKERSFKISRHIVGEQHQDEFISSFEASIPRYLLKFYTGMLLGYVTPRKHK